MLPFVTKLDQSLKGSRYAALAMAFLMPGALAIEQVSHSSLADQVAVAASRPFKQSAPVAPAAATSLEKVRQTAKKTHDEEVLWLARCIYSETKRPIEQIYVAWVVRNRVESQYRGLTSYREVVLDPHQFSAFRAGTYTRNYYSSLTRKTQTPGWQQALQIAHYVMQASPRQRPFSILTRHFYSQRSRQNARPPQWSQNLSPTPLTEHQVDQERFRFFTGVL